MVIIGGHKYTSGGRHSACSFGNVRLLCHRVGRPALFAQGKQKLLLLFSAANLCINGGINLC